MVHCCKNVSNIESTVPNITCPLLPNFVKTSLLNLNKNVGTSFRKSHFWLLFVLTPRLWNWFAYKRFWSLNQILYSSKLCNILYLHKSDDIDLPKKFCSMKWIFWFTCNQIYFVITSWITKEKVCVRWECRLLWKNSLTVWRPKNSPKKVEAYNWVVSICLKYVSLPWHMVNSPRRGASEPWAWREFYKHPVI